MFSKKFFAISMLAVLLIAIAACGGPPPTPQTITVIETVEVIQTVEVVKEVEGETITVIETVEVVVEKEVEKIIEVDSENPDAGRVRLDTHITSEPPSLDPSLATDTTSSFFIDQMFMGLTAFDEKANVIPSLATDWEVSEDGLVWTFNMRDDVQWVHRDPSTGAISTIRPVTAEDVAFGILRTLHPDTASDYAYILYIIAGAEEYNTTDPASEEFADLEVGVEVIDETTIQITVMQPAAYFPSIVGQATTYAQPAETIEQYGDNWTEAGNIVTNGPYTLRDWRHSAEIFIEKNPEWIKADQVQIEIFGGPIIQEASTAMAMYENNELDTMADPGDSPPLPDMDRIKADAQMSKELLIAPRLCTYYYGFVNTKPPFDDPLVRKAFAAAMDRQSIIDFVTKGDQVPAHSFTPPGIFGNVAEDFSIGGFMVEDSYDDQLAQAQEWIAEAGYPNGAGLDVLLMHNTSEAHAQIAQAVQAMWQEAFPEASVNIENQEWAVYLKTLQPDSEDSEKPNIYRSGWCADYPDANNWLNEVFNSMSNSNYAKFNNPEYDALVEEAASVADPETRADLYHQAEQILIQDVTAISPIYYYTFIRLYKPWVSVVINPVGGDPVWLWTVDAEAKAAARGE
ncbi:peptide ABC transporter substrate-binding protein [Anaerolineales bacterium HSG24]|nr:peptide ABC transporter substrate-binding protein [Anaerolineales bacterium HSG24]